MKIHKQLEEQRLAASEAKHTAHKNNIRSLKEQQMLSNSITTVEGFVNQPRPMRIALYDRGNAYIARILIMVLGEHGRAIVDDISHGDGMAIKRAMQNFIESEYEDPIAHARSQIQSIRQDKPRAFCSNRKFYPGPWKSRSAHAECLRAFAMASLATGMR